MRSSRRPKRARHQHASFLLGLILSLHSHQQSVEAFQAPLIDKNAGGSPVPDYLRWKTNINDPLQQSHQQDDRNSFELQTAVTTFRKGDQTVELHAQLHLGSPAYFEYYNQNTFRNDKDAILFELLLDENLLQDADLIRNPNQPRRRQLIPTAQIQASPSDQAMAAQYGWICQADAIDYTQSNFYHADLTRQE